MRRALTRPRSFHAFRPICIVVFGNKGDLALRSVSRQRNFYTFKLTYVVFFGVKGPKRIEGRLTK